MPRAGCLCCIQLTRYMFMFMVSLSCLANAAGTLKLCSHCLAIQDTSAGYVRPSALCCPVSLPALPGHVCLSCFNQHRKWASFRHRRCTQRSTASWVTLGYVMSKCPSEVRWRPVCHKVACVDVELRPTQTAELRRQVCALIVSPN